MKKRIWLLNLLVVFSGGVLAADPVEAGNPVPGTKVVQGQVYSYVRDGVRYYTSKPPIGAEQLRTIGYSFLDTQLPPPSTKWREVYIDDNVAIYQDSSTGTHIGDVRKRWTRYHYTESFSQGRFSGIRKIVSLDSYHCKERTTTNRETVFYSTDKVLGSTRGDGYAGAVVPDSLGEAVWANICGRQ